VTQLVSQVLNFVRRLSDRIVEDCEPRRRSHSVESMTVPAAGFWNFPISPAKILVFTLLQQFTYINLQLDEMPQEAMAALI
jgi:hypothetical protein